MVGNQYFITGKRLIKRHKELFNKNVTYFKRKIQSKLYNNTMSVYSSVKNGALIQIDNRQHGTGFVSNNK